VVLIDIDLGGESGLELAGRLNHQEDLGTRIILISSHDEEDYRDLIAASPAVGILSKDTLSARGYPRPARRLGRRGAGLGDHG
jgi:DNA-binding NarL/FixJ family response regulator